MVAAMVRHLHSLRMMRRDHGWIHTLLGIYHIVLKAYSHWRFFSSEKRAIFFSLRLVLVFSIVLFRLAIFQQFSQARTKIACKQMGAVPIQVIKFCKQTYKINIKIAWKNRQCEYVKIYHLQTQKITRLRKSPM